MKTDIRLGSVVKFGVGGPECHIIDVIYIYLMHEFKQNHYRRISINQIGEDLNECIIKEPGKMIHVNIRYPVFEDFNNKSDHEKNMIRLDIVHNALLRIAAYEEKIDRKVLDEIKEKIVENNFQFDFVFKEFVHTRRSDLIGRIIVRPYIEKMEFYLELEESNKIKCRQLFYIGRSVAIFLEFFTKGKWKGSKELIVSGKKKEMEIVLNADTCKVEIVNLTPYKNPPFFTLMKADITEEERDMAKKDWNHSIPPGMASIINYEPN